MNIIDLIILILLVLAIIKGLFDGFIKQIAAIGGIFLGFWLAYKFSGVVSPYITKWIPSLNEAAVKAISFILVIIVAIIAVHFLALLVEKIIKISMLGWLNKILGVVISLVTFSIIIGLSLHIVLYINKHWFTIIPPETIASSKLFLPLSDLANTLFPYIAEFFKF